MMQDALADLSKAFTFGIRMFRLAPIHYIDSSNISWISIFSWDYMPNHR